MIVTKKYLMEHRTSSGAWTKAQFDVLGLQYPPRSGWVAMVKGRELTAQQQQQFEEGKFVNSDGKLSHIKKLVRQLAPDQIAHLAEWVRRL